MVNARRRRNQGAIGEIHQWVTHAGMDDPTERRMKSATCSSSGPAPATAVQRRVSPRHPSFRRKSVDVNQLSSPEAGIPEVHPSFTTAWMLRGPGRRI